MYQFTGVIKNELRPEPGVNITLKGLKEERIILAPTGPWHDLEFSQDSNTLNLTFIPSSGTTEGRAVEVEVSNGKGTTNTNPHNWEVKLEASSESDPANVTIAIVYAETEK
ncbi:MAG: hypothetical protein PVH61_36775 [Candidatus Aminicenantes bacterium]|jgi:hypothetical protein